MLKEILKETVESINEAFVSMARIDYNAFILFIGRAGVIPHLKEDTGNKSNCVIDYHLDKFYDETREAFYLRYMNKYYPKYESDYQGDEGIDRLHVEMMIYSHIWESHYFLKSLYRIASILSGKGYSWIPTIPEGGKYDSLNKYVIKPLSDNGYKLGGIIDKSYKSSIRNAFAHSLYYIDPTKKNIHLKPRSGSLTLTFKEFQRCFLDSVLLMNQLQNTLEYHHNKAAEVNKALTEPFKTPDNILVQVIAEMKYLAGIQYPRFRLIPVKEEQ